MSLNSYNPTTGELTRIAGGTLYADAPVGSIQAFGGSSAPSGWLLCHGQELNRSDYPELFSVIGTAFGTPSANTKFKLPDLRGEFLRGAGTNSHSGQGNGGTLGQHQDATCISDIWTYGTDIYAKCIANPADATNHKNADYEDGNSSGLVKQKAAPNALISYETTPSTGGLYTSRPTNTSVNYIIKAKQTAVAVDIAEQIKNPVIVQDANIDIPAMSTTGEYTLTKVVTIPTGYKLITFGAIANNHYAQTLLHYRFDPTSSSVIVSFYNGFGAVGAYSNGVKVAMILGKL